MRQRVSFSLTLPLTLLLLLCVYESRGGSVRNTEAIAPDISSSVSPQPFLPLLAPSPLTAFTNYSIPKLSGLCTLNFSAAGNMMSVTATDCWASFAPLLADVVCCPQFDATLATLIGQSSKYSRMLALNVTHAKHCLSDVQKILEGQGANENIQKICSIEPETLTAASCPVIEVDTFESTVDSSKLLGACRKIDLVNECCDQVCQNAILDAARTIAVIGMPNSKGVNLLPEHSTRIDGCKNIVLRWLASNLDPSSANKVLRGLSNCKVNKEYGCLLPSLPSDATYDITSGISFICDLNDNIAAPWPSSSSDHPSSCKKTTKLPAVPKATSAKSGLINEDLIFLSFFSSLLVLKMLL
ncbi:uncharacterized GPI-anchored protein At1g61900-like isoform X2 [Prunus dulcis]|uniref:uncharacterized GPI-anchored protein At1g61900-like isoform X2 n=1 Tax=Prunus dulcis TaxID=3755 RepID=UPI001483A117|nr:uncharacterized GPI-anchored protein At1g61900-like isoform X2 [Prunus dulcis]